MPTTDLEQALNIIRRLINCPDLNLESLEDETIEALDEAVTFLLHFKEN